MTPPSDPSHDAGMKDWKRFNDEIFSLHAGPASADGALVSDLANMGIELIVDARPGPKGETRAMEAGCEQAGLYYVPALTERSTTDLPLGAAARFADLALRHKTCVVVDDGSDELLSRITEQHALKTTPLDSTLDESVS
jgi:hypothetical protein